MTSEELLEVIQMTNICKNIRFHKHLKKTFVYAFNARWVLGSRGAPVRWVVEVAFWTPSEPIGKCPMRNLENTNSSGYSQLSVSVDPDEFINGATLLWWGPKSNEKYRVFLTFWSKSIVSSSKSEDFDIWRPRTTLKELVFLILLFELQVCFQKVPPQK